MNNAQIRETQTGCLFAFWLNAGMLFVIRIALTPPYTQRESLFLFLFGSVTGICLMTFFCSMMLRGYMPADTASEIEMNFLDSLKREDRL